MAKGDPSKPNTGCLFPNDKGGNANRADARGNVVIGEDLINYIAECISNGQPAELELAAWYKTANSGMQYTSLTVAIPWKIKKDRDAGIERIQPPRVAPSRAVHASLTDDLPF